MSLVATNAAKLAMYKRIAKTRRTYAHSAKELGPSVPARPLTRYALTARIQTTILKQNTPTSTLVQTTFVHASNGKLHYAVRELTMVSPSTHQISPTTSPSAPLHTTPGHTNTQPISPSHPLSCIRFASLPSKNNY